MHSRNKLVHVSDIITIIKRWELQVDDINETCQAGMLYQTQAETRVKALQECANELRYEVGMPKREI